MPTLAKNKRARFDYEILDTLEAGVMLSGAEAKATREGQMKLVESYVTFKGDIPYLTNAHISRYSKSDQYAPYDPTRPRKLLLKKSEIAMLIGKKSRDGLTIVPLSAYTSRGVIKIEIGLARGKKKHDKREVLKKRDIDRDVRRDLKRG